MQFVRCCVLLVPILRCAYGQKNLMLANERSTLDDCHLRFHKLQVSTSPKPAFGHPARLKEFAHMGAIGWTQPNGNITWSCGGTLIWNNFVLTAAHCVVDSGNNAPDVVRFGDLDIYSSKDDEFAQQIRIVEIVRHPQHRFARNYHDIALLKLEKNVTLHDTVMPACLWTDDEVRFKVLEATGWGKTGFANEQTPVLLKVALKPIENRECSQFYTNDTSRKLRSGLQDHHICAVDDKMDTCEGDSGGPLQVKLLHNGRVTPFLVAITSFGMACGTSTPGVYTKVAPYHDWIIDSMQKLGARVDGSTYNATFCALRFAFLREYEDAVIMSRTDSYVSVDSDERHMFFGELPSYMVTLKWFSGVEKNCHGVIIDEDTVLTVAECTAHNGSPVTHVLHANQNTNNISKIVVHPEYTQGTAYNNIAILRLEKMFSLSNMQPTCIWHETNLPHAANVYGFGRRDINDFLYIGERARLDPTLSILKPRATVQNTTSCIVSKQHLPKIQKGLKSEHICTGNSIFLVPGSCELMIGAPFDATEYRVDNTYPMTFGLNQFGRDCGFGEHSIATSLASHVGWMKTVLLPNYHEPSIALHFLDSQLHVGDTCEHNDGKAARCVPISMCSHKWKEFLAKGTLQFCSTSSVVCCPLDDIESNRLRADLEKCPNLVKSLNPEYAAGSMVLQYYARSKFIFKL